MRVRPYIPLSTYRFQFNRDFTFRDATRLIPYLSSMGISDCYASPYLRARPGSAHGYDIIDHNSLNPEIGSTEDYEQFVTELHRHGMGQVLDIVPNHMGVMGSDNAWWLDVLENGEVSVYAEFFDIDWYPIKDELEGKVLVPILAEQYGNVLEKGELKLVFDKDRGEFSIFYFQHRFPINPKEYPRILRYRLSELEAKLGPTNDDVLELQSIATAFGHLPGRQDASPEKIVERNREKEVQKRRLAALCARSTSVCEAISEDVQLLNGSAGDSRSFDSLHELIKAQAYRLAQWRVAADDINYRRFFDINDLAALRMENPAVFAVTHRLVLDLFRSGKLNGLRLDHPDGLYDPLKYFRQLQHEVGGGEINAENCPGYVVVEKILVGDEKLRKDWPVYGSTGYEFGSLVNGIFVDHTTASRMDRIYRSFTGRTETLGDLIYDCKKLILKVALASEVNVLANALSRIALANRHTCDFTLNSLRSALAEIVACFPVYRTYVSDEGISQEDRHYIEQGVAAGAKRSNLPDPTVFDFIRRVLLIDSNGDEPQWYRKARVRFAMKFQQVTSAAMAKGLEDTAFYRYNRLISLNEVGGDPARFGISVDAFHRANHYRMRYWPHGMLSTSTHDSKRSEDVRARINVLSEMPAQWRSSLRRWRDWNRGKKKTVEGAPAPDRNDEYLLYQILLGTWPLQQELDDAQWQVYVSRIQQYMLKVVREGKEHSSWANPNLEYEAALQLFVNAILDRKRKNRFLREFEEFQLRISRFGMFNSLSQTLLKLTSPGMPDIYQGNEVWDFSMVDPDNRRTVDYAAREKLLDELQTPEGGKKCGAPCQARSLLNSMEDSRIKLYLTWKTLSCRRDRTKLFQHGHYIPLNVNGPAAKHICAFAREFEGEIIIVVVPRLYATLLGDKILNPLGQEVWSDTRLELPANLQPSHYRNVFTEESIQPESNDSHCTFAISQILDKFPVALLVGSHQ